MFVIYLFRGIIQVIGICYGIAAIDQKRTAYISHDITELFTKQTNEEILTPEYLEKRIKKVIEFLNEKSRGLARFTHVEIEGRAE